MSVLAGTGSLSAGGPPPSASSDASLLVHRFAETGTLRVASPGLVLARLGDIDGTVFLIRAGQAKMTAPTDRGPAVVGFRYPGQFIGIAAAMHVEPRVTTASACSEGLTVHMLTAERFRYYLSRSREAAWEVSRLLAARLHDETLRRLENQGPVASRIARCLLHLAPPSDDVDSDIVELTQAELAATIGASQVSVENELRKLRATQVIGTSYGAILIRDRDALLAMTGRPGPGLPLTPGRALRRS
jgi:CRP/FNR family cyclic AMP-dependent transcriptional regulator